MPRSVPIPHEFVERLAALDARCDISLNRRSEYWTGRTWTSIPEPSFHQHRRAWFIRVTLRGGHFRDTIDVQELALAAAIEKAIAAAEARGWHRRDP